RLGPAGAVAAPPAPTAPGDPRCGDRTAGGGPCGSGVGQGGKLRRPGSHRSPRRPGVGGPGRGLLPPAARSERAPSGRPALIRVGLGRIVPGDPGPTGRPRGRTRSLDPHAARSPPRGPDPLLPRMEGLSRLSLDLLATRALRTHPLDLDQAGRPARSEA